MILDLLEAIESYPFAQRMIQDAKDQKGPNQKEVDPNRKMMG